MFSVFFFLCVCVCVCGCVCVCVFFHFLFGGSPERVLEDVDTRILYAYINIYIYTHVGCIWICRGIWRSIMRASTRVAYKLPGGACRGALIC